jgi:hypothetical protein
MNSTSVPERRGARRVARDDSAILSARIRPGHPVTIVNVSVGGVLVEIDRRLLPGSWIHLQVETASRKIALRAQVLRCAVVSLRSSSVWYRAAMAFEYPVPMEQVAVASGERVASSRAAS